MKFRKSQPAPQQVHIDTLGSSGSEPREKNVKSETQAVEITVDLFKAETKHLAYGVVLTPGLRDSQGDVVGKDEIERAAHRYLVESRKADVQHTEEERGIIPAESFIAPSDMEIGGKLVKEGSWVMAWKVEDPEVWERVSNPEHPEPLTGLSIGGSAIRLQED